MDLTHDSVGSHIIKFQIISLEREEDLKFRRIRRAVSSQIILAIIPFKVLSLAAFFQIM